MPKKGDSKQQQQQMSKEDMKKIQMYLKKMCEYLRDTPQTIGNKIKIKDDNLSIVGKIQPTCGKCGKWVRKTD